MPQYFERRRALANGIAATGSSIGGVLYPIVFYKLQQEVGFAWATRALAFVCLGTGSVSIAVMRVRFKPKQRRAMLQLSAFREAYYSIYTLGSFFGMLGFYNFLIYIQPWAIGKRVISANLGFYLLPILNAASTFGRITPNFLADHIGPLNMLVPAVGATALLAFCWIVVSSTVGIIILVFLYGFFSGGFVSLISVVMVVITKDLRTYGTRLGMFFAIASVAVLIGTPIGGVIVSDTDSYLGVQVFSGACLAVCTAITFLLRVMRSGPKFIYKT
jgi:predicted MFS family arabinose efflux permease